ncbi:MAG: hypothetical protein KDC71_22810, partial [Acidobacteria bacterium]|nr:hypothetical protein [Acidobacteriota bacterium]
NGDLHSVQKVTGQKVSDSVFFYESMAGLELTDCAFENCYYFDSEMAKSYNQIRFDHVCWHACAFRGVTFEDCQFHWSALLGDRFNRLKFKQCSVHLAIRPSYSYPFLIFDDCDLDLVIAGPLDKISFTNCRGRVLFLTLPIRMKQNSPELCLLHGSHKLPRKRRSLPSSWRRGTHFGLAFLDFFRFFVAEGPVSMFVKGIPVRFRGPLKKGWRSFAIPSQSMKPIQIPANQWINLQTLRNQHGF